MSINNLNSTFNEVLTELMKYHGYVYNLFDTLDKILPENWINNQRLQINVSSILWYLHLQNPELQSLHLLFALGEIISPMLKYNLEVECFTVTYDNN